MKPIISVEGLGKRYTIRHEGRERYRSLREEIFQLPKRLWQRSQESKEDFWALKDVTFDIMPGDRVGIIGRNGAGKSTLLKLLSRITEPTTGRITLRGRVASLLEVGTGFHPELTGRENIYLNGAILGMSRAEVRRKFDEIVDFAGVEQFLDTPVKRYSSGMYVRLAFAVAAHLEPEILIVDEVLAVGDAEFQKKCLGKMEEVGKEGRTVLFVSHNRDSILRLTKKPIVLSGGRNIYINYTKKAIEKYENLLLNTTLDMIEYSGNGNIEIKDVIICDGNKNIDLCYIDLGSNIYFNILLYAKDVLLYKKIFIAIYFYDNKNNKIYFSLSNHHSGDNIVVDKKNFYLKCNIKKFPLSPGEYYVNISIYDYNNELCRMEYIKKITVINNAFINCYIPKSILPTVFCDHSWSIDSCI